METQHFPNWQKGGLNHLSSQKDKHGVLENGIFDYRAAKDGKVFISWHGKQITILSGKTAEKFLAKAETADFMEVQLLMAKATGNFKHGNEKGNRPL